jgi:hypothetical protein
MRDLLTFSSRPDADTKGSSAALLLFAVLFIRFLVQLQGNVATPAEKGQEFMDILIVAVTVIVVAIPGMEESFRIWSKSTNDVFRGPPTCRDVSISICNGSDAEGEQPRTTASGLRDNGKRHCYMLG